MTSIFKREFRSYFTGGIGFVYCAAFSLVMNIVYYLNSVTFYKSTFLYIFNIMLIAMIFLIPLMTMRIWSEEKKQKTDQLLLTSPVSVSEIVLGKYFAALCLFLCSLSLTLVYPILALMFGTLQVGISVGNYIAIIFAAGAYIAISQFMSSLTESQIISAVASMVTLSLFFFLNLAFQSTEIGIISQITSFLSIITRFTNFFSGIFTLSDIVYFVSLIVLFLFLTARVIEKRRWS